MPHELARCRASRSACAFAAVIAVFAPARVALCQEIADSPQQADTRSANTDWKLTAADRESVESLGKTLIEAINASNDDDRRRLVHLTFDEKTLGKIGVQAIAGQLQSIAERFPQLAFTRAELTEHQMGDRISRVLHVYARRPGDKLWRDLQLYVSAEKPHRLEQLVFIAEVTEPITLPNGDITDPQTQEWLNAYVDGLVTEHDLSGCALIASGDRIIYERYFGYADLERKRPVTPDTLFSLASAGKMFTAVGIARLVADGKLAYADTLDKFFPEFPNQDFASRVTIAHLLSHSSGVAEYWTQETAPDVRQAGSTAEMLPLVLKAGQNFEPGAKHAYSNSNYILAGLIIERITGKPFEQFIDAAIFQPLAMTHTGYFESGDESRPIAQALSRDGQAWKASPRNRRGTAAGGCFSTARDMLRFIAALKSGALIPTQSLATMTTSTVSPGIESDSDYGYGFLLQRNAQVFSYGHGGIAPGINAEVRYFPALDITLILLNNQDSGAYDDLRKNTIRLITGER